MQTAKKIASPHRSQPDDERLLTRADVEERFGISKRFLETSAANGHGPDFVRVGRLVRYRARDVAAWIESQVVRGRG